MASVSIHIQAKAYRDGTVPVFLRIIHRRKLYTKQIARVPLRDIDMRSKRIKKSNPEHIMLNQILVNKEKEAREYLLMCEIDGIEPDPASFLKHGTGQCISEWLRELGAKLITQGRVPYGESYIALAHKIEIAKLDIPIRAVNDKWMKSLDAAFIARGNAATTRSTAFAMITSVLRGMPLVKVPSYKVRPGDSYKPKLTEEEFVLLRDAPLAGRQAIVRDMFIFAMYARGVRIFKAMTMRHNNIIDSRIEYAASKGGKLHSIAIHPHAAAIIERNRTGSEYIFDIMDVPYSMYESAKTKQEYLARHKSLASIVNKTLRQIVSSLRIEKYITFHSARHTFTAMARRSGADSYTIQQFLGHSNLETSERYIREVMRSDELDQAADKIFGD